MMTTDTEITVMGVARGIGPWSAGSEAAALKGEDPIAATGQSMTRGGHCLATTAMKGAVSRNDRDTAPGQPQITISGEDLQERV